MFKQSIFITILGLALSFTACSETEKSDPNTPEPVNKYTLTSTDNKQFIVEKKEGGFIVEGAKGKVVIFDIFATWCPPCQAGATHLTSLQNKFKDDLVIIGITIEDGISNTRLDEFKKDFNAQYPIVNSKDNRPLVDEIALALKLGERFPIPIMAMYKDGVLINHYIGEVQEEFVQSDINNALGK